MNSVWFCNMGHRIEQNLWAINSPVPITFCLGGNNKSKQICPYCLIKWIDENLPAMWEAVGVEDE